MLIENNINIIFIDFQIEYSLAHLLQKVSSSKNFFEVSKTKDTSYSLKNPNQIVQSKSGTK